MIKEEFFYNAFKNMDMDLSCLKTLFIPVSF